MSVSRNVVLVCVDQDNVENCLVLLHSLSKHYHGEILLCYCKTLDNRVLEMSKGFNNKVTMLQFLQRANEDGMVVKALMTAYRSNLSKILYLRSSCVVRSSLSPLFSVESAGYPLLAADDYTYKGQPHWVHAYASEDRGFHHKKDKYLLRYFDAGVVMFCMPGIKNSGLDIKGLFDRFLKKGYAIKLGVGEFLNEEFRHLPVKFLDRDYNSFGDKYLYNSKNYHKSIRTNHRMKTKGVIVNFEDCAPWSDACEFNRGTIQFPVQCYESEVLELEGELSVEFVANVVSNAKKWRSRLGNLPLKISEYFEVKNGPST